MADANQAGIALPEPNPAVATASCARPGCPNRLQGKQRVYCSAACKAAVWEAEHGRVNRSTVRQRLLALEPAAELIRAIDQPPLDAQERKRLKPTAIAVLRRLQQGPATNYELATICLNYKGRVNELRCHHDIRSQRVEGPKWLYWLVVE